MRSQDLGQGEPTSTPVEANEPYSVIGVFSSFNGRYESDRDLVVQGSLSGEIRCRAAVFIAPGATVSAMVTTQDLRVAGELEGDVECSGKFELLSSGRVHGRVRANELVILSGGQLDGDVEMGRATVSEPDTASRKQRE